eukprot:648446-Hanusia_phi.AAC.5
MGGLRNISGSRFVRNEREQEGKRKEEHGMEKSKDQRVLTSTRSARRATDQPYPTCIPHPDIPRIDNQ